MGNSTFRLQDVIDYVGTIGDLAPVIPAGGWGTKLPLLIANDVMNELIAQRFNWKWNQITVPPFYSNSLQQDYATPATNIGWLQRANMIDINNSSQPKPLFWLECVRELERSSVMFGPPRKICWLPNDQLVYGVWGGSATSSGNDPLAAGLYSTPIGATRGVNNAIAQVVDPNGNLQAIDWTQIAAGASAPNYGPSTNPTSPVWPGANAAAGTSTAGGPAVTAANLTSQVIWKVMDAKACGFRIDMLPSPGGVIWQVNVTAQAKAPKFATIQQTIDPVPDDYRNYFVDGFIAYMHRHSTAPMVTQRFEQKRRLWLEALAAARGQGDRERDDAGFVPDRGFIDQNESGSSISPAWPYGPR